MNSLNIISARVSPSASPVPSRSNSLSTIGLAAVASVAEAGVDEGVDAVRDEEDDARVLQQAEKLTAEPEDEYRPELPPSSPPLPQSHHAQHHLQRNEHAALPASLASPTAAAGPSDGYDETSPLLSPSEPPLKEMGVRSSGWHQISRRLASSVINSLRWVLTTFVATPGYYLIAWLYDENGVFAPFVQLRRMFGGRRACGSKLVVDYHGDGADDIGEKYGQQGLSVSSVSTPSGLTSTSESESELDVKGQNGDGLHGAGGNSKSTSRHSRSKSLSPSDDAGTARRSIRIKLHSEDAGGRPRKHRKAQSASAAASSASVVGSAGGGGGGLRSSDISAQLKSPTSPAGALTKYPKTPAPPRPLIPRRQPSYINMEPTDRAHQKTLILDLDETLIHSMSKGGRMGSGHMVEVRLNTTYVGVGGQASIGPQHPILYYVHKRPHCDHFLRRVCKWYNLVVFTASVQEYADPVIDWLESERKFFSARFYRQHCTVRHGAYIKDLSSVEPDLSKVVILDNSPLSYLFHPDNAIPIQGWITDPTDNDLLHLVPFLEGLQYVSDVRALLALRGGEDGQHMA